MRCSLSRRRSFSLSPLSDCVMFDYFIVEPWLLFSYDQLGCCGYLRCVGRGSSTFCLDVVFPCDFGYYRLLWNHFGYDRPKNDSGSCFSPVKALIAGLLHAHSGFLLGLHWSGE